MQFNSFATNRSPISPLFEPPLKRIAKISKTIIKLKNTIPAIIYAIKITPKTIYIISPCPAKSIIFIAFQLICTQSFPPLFTQRSIFLLNYIYNYPSSTSSSCRIASILQATLPSSLIINLLLRTISLIFERHFSHAILSTGNTSRFLRQYP